MACRVKFETRKISCIYIIYIYDLMTHSIHVWYVIPTFTIKILDGMGSYIRSYTSGHSFM